MKWKDMDENSRIDRVGEIVMKVGFGSLILAVIFQIGRAIVFG